MRGRETKLTPEVQNAIVAAITAGNYRETAAAAAGVHRTTLRNWELRGEAGEEPFASFATELQAAEAQAEIESLDRIRTARPSTEGRGADLWQKDAWMMERRWPKRWSGRVRLTVNQELASLMDRLTKKLDAETLRKVIDAAREDAGFAEDEAPRH